MNIAIIPARGGSKRIPRKNIREFAGKPMIAWSIEAAKRSGLFEHIIVSTDDEEIASIAKLFGAEVPFLRPTFLADDHTPTRPVVNHAINEVACLYGMPLHVCCLYPAIPFMTSLDLQQAFELMKAEHADFVFTAGRYPHPVQRSFFVTPSGGLQRLFPEHRLTRTQDLQEMFHDAGQFYWGRGSAFLSDGDSVSERSRAFILPAYRVHDIDTHEDWERAEKVFNALCSGGKL